MNEQIIIAIVLLALAAHTTHNAVLIDKLRGDVLRLESELYKLKVHK